MCSVCERVRRLGRSRDSLWAYVGARCEDDRAEGKARSMRCADCRACLHCVGVVRRVLGERSQVVWVDAVRSPHTAKIGSNELLNWGNEKYSDKQYEGFRHLKAISAFVYDSQLAL